MSNSVAARSVSVYVPRPVPRAPTLQCLYRKRDAAPTLSPRLALDTQSKRWKSRTTRSPPKTALFFPGTLPIANPLPCCPTPIPLPNSISQQSQAKASNASGWPIHGSPPFPIPANPSSKRPTRSSTSPSPAPSPTARTPPSPQRAWPSPPSWRPR